jgi:hypothetical protein
VHQQKRETERQRQHDHPDDVRDGEVRRLGEIAAGDRAREHGNALYDLALRKNRVQVPFESACRQGVDEPCLDGTGEEREAEAEEHRRKRPRPEGRSDAPHQEIEKRRQREGQGSEQV